MPRTCTTCTHPHRDEIDRRLLDGASLRNITKQFSLSSASLFRHNKHISKVLIWNDPSTTSNCFLLSSFHSLGGSASRGRGSFRDG